MAEDKPLKWQEVLIAIPFLLIIMITVIVVFPFFAVYDIITRIIDNRRWK